MLFPDNITDSTKRNFIQSLHTKLDVNVWFCIGLQIAKGLDYVHQKSIVHRDLKTDNIAMYEQNEKIFPVIVDFGKSEFLSNTKKYSLTEEAKKEYRVFHKHIAPDVVDGIAKPSTLSDMYSYGRVFKSIVRYFHITRESIPPSIVDMVNKCLLYQSQFT